MALEYRQLHAEPLKVNTNLKKNQFQIQSKVEHLILNLSGIISCVVVKIFFCFELSVRF